MICVITPGVCTRDSFLMCAKCVGHQSTVPDMWLIIDDSSDGFVESCSGYITVPYAVVRVDGSSGKNSNMRTALSRVAGDYCICVFSDSVWYPRDYIRDMTDGFSSAKVIVPHYVYEYDVHARHVRKVKYDNNGLSVCLFGVSVSAAAVSTFRGIVDMCTNDAYTEIANSSDVLTEFNDDSIPVRFYGVPFMDYSVSGITGCDIAWGDDPESSMLHDIVGADFQNYLGHSPVIYVFSNVTYSEHDKIEVRDDDLLVFINRAVGLDYYRDHKNTIVYHRAPRRSYGDEQLCFPNRYVYDAGSLSIPRAYLDKFEKEYDWDYVVSDGSSKSATTGYSVVRYLNCIYPNLKLVLVNFGYSVQHSTYRCPWHNWIFENKYFSAYKHIFTASTVSGESPFIVCDRRRKAAPASEKELAAIFTANGCDQMTSHDYGAVYDSVISRFRGTSVSVCVLCVNSLSLARAVSHVMPHATVYCIGSELRCGNTDGVFVVSGDGYSQAAWSSIPDNISLVIDDGTHDVNDMLRGVDVFRSHMSGGGTIMFEDIKSEQDVTRLVSALPGASVHRTAQISPYGDDRVLVYDFTSTGSVGFSRRSSGARGCVSDAFTALVRSSFMRNGCDRVIGHAYAPVFSSVFSRFVGMRSTIVEIGGFGFKGLTSIHSVLPLANLYGIVSSVVDGSGVDFATVISGDYYTEATWSQIPRNVDLIIDDGTHIANDIIRAVPMFLSHLARSGCLVIEDIRSDSDASRILDVLPGAVCFNTEPVSKYGDDRIIVYYNDALVVR